MIGLIVAIIALSGGLITSCFWHIILLNQYYNRYKKSRKKTKEPCIICVLVKDIANADCNIAKVGAKSEECLYFSIYYCPECGRSLKEES